ncbi:MAG: glutamate-5-semialdehyde dehydrogenase [bacterium]
MISEKQKEQILEMCQRAKAAAGWLATTPTETKNAMLNYFADLLEANTDRILKTNAEDLKRAKEEGLSKALLDRLSLSKARIGSMVEGVRSVASLPDPVGEVTKSWTLPNGIHMQRVRVPIGVIGIIYEARPSVTVDASVLCLKAGNATILRGGREAFVTNSCLATLMADAADLSRLPKEVVSLVPMIDREAVPFLCEQYKHIDLMIPRGGYSLIETVTRHARMPVIKHYQGICHIYVHAKANLDMAEKIIINAKCQRPGVCNAVETVLLDAAIAKTFAPRLLKILKENHVNVLADVRASAAAGEKLDEPQTWAKEYLDLILAVRVVDGAEEAIAHVEKYGSHHSDAIVTEDKEAAERFLKGVDSAAVYWNASTRFTDGHQFGMGAEIGISTDKIHARGPMGLEELTSYKYIARGSGQVRE